MEVCETDPVLLSQTLLQVLPFSKISPCSLRTLQSESLCSKLGALGLMPLTLGTRAFFVVGTVLRTVGCEAPSLVSTLWVPVAHLAQF